MLKGYNSSLMDPAYLFEKKFSILQEISSAIVVTDNISSISNLMLDLAINYTNAEKGSLMLLNEKEELYILASRGIDLQFIRAYRVKVGEGIAGTVAVNRLPVLVRDIEADERFRGKTRDRYKTKSFISCPIMIKNKLLGVINLNDKKDGMPFDNDELELIKIIANHAAITIENAFLMNQLKKKASELDDINKKLIDSDIVKSEFITRVSHELRTPLNSIKGAIYYLQESEKITENEKRDFHHIIAGETDKLVSIVENLLNFLRLEDEARIIKKTVISIKDVLSNVSQTRSLKTLLTRGNIQLKILLDEPVSDIVGDRIKVIQLFLNLLEGLCPFLEKGDGIRISAEENDFISIRLRASRRMPESVFQYLNSTRSIFQTDLPEEFLKLYLSRSITDVHQWNLVAENGKDDFRLTIKIPKSIQYKIEAFVNQSLDLFVDFISEVLDLSICSVMLTDELTSELTIRSSRGLSDDIIKRTHVKFGEKIAGWVALEGKPLLVENVETDPRFAKSSISQYNTKSLLTLPVKIDNRVIGVLNLNNKGTSEPFTAIDYYIASALSERFSLFIKNLYDGTCTEQEFKNFLKSFESLLNAEKKFHKKKKSLLPHLMSLIMDSLGASEEERKTAVYVSMIYDLGVGLIDESVLNKKSLSASELRTLRVHPQNSVSLLDNFEYSETVKSSILHHHERYDGHGYPDGLAGEDIPFLSRVLAVADAFCAMVVDRPHRKAIKKEAALAEIKSGSGSIYDPKIVNVLEGIVALL